MKVRFLYERSRPERQAIPAINLAGDSIADSVHRRRSVRQKPSGASLPSESARGCSRRQVTIPGPRITR
jgi:hypothetical protein